MASSKKLSISLQPVIREKLILVCEQLDFQRIVDWVNAYAERSESITRLDDEEFTVLAGYLVQNTSFQLASELDSLLPQIEDSQFRSFLARLRDELKHWSLRELHDAQAYGLVGLWGHQRRQLCSYLGLKFKSSNQVKGTEVLETSLTPNPDETDEKPLN